MAFAFAFHYAQTHYLSVRESSPLRPEAEAYSVLLRPPRLVYFVIVSTSSQVDRKIDVDKIQAHVLVIVMLMVV